MPANKKVKAAIINESSTSVERLAAKIISLTRDGETFVKTCVSMTDAMNLPAIKRLGEELTPGTNKGFLGIGITSYTNINYILFYSSIRSLKLHKGDRLNLLFEDGKELTFEFMTNSKRHGYVQTNSCFIEDAQLEYLAGAKLRHWVLYDKATGLLVKGGFECSEYNQQYQSKKSGQTLFQNMVKEILALKPHLKTA